MRVHRAIIKWSCLISICKQPEPPSLQCYPVLLAPLCLSVTVPSWINEKAPDVSVTSVLVQSNVGSTVIYVAIGLIGAWAYPVDCPSNVLTSLSKPGIDPSAMFDIITRVTAMIWSFWMIGW